MCEPCKHGYHCDSPACTCQHRPCAGGDNGCPYCRGSQNPDMRDHVRNVHPDRFPEWEEVDWSGRPSSADVDAMIEVVAGAVHGVPLCEYACVHPQADHLPGRGCMRTGCLCLWRMQDVVSGPVGDPPVSADPGIPVPTPQAPPVAGTGAPRVDDAQGFVSVLADWMREHRAGRFGQAAVLRRSLVGYLGRMGGPDDLGGVDRG